MNAHKTGGIMEGTKRMKYGKLFLAVIFLSAAYPRAAKAALPPSQQTKEEILWDKLSRSAHRDLTSDQTNYLMSEFLTLYPQDPKAAQVVYMSAEKEFVKGNYQKAAVLFEKFASKYPEHALADSAAFRLAESYYNAGAFNSAYEAWDRMTKRFKNSALIPDALEYLAALRIRNREWGKADEAIQKLRSGYPEFADQVRVRENWGVVLYHLGEYDESAKILEGIDDGKGAFYRGLSLFALTLYADAVGALSRINLDKTSPYRESAGFLKAEGFFQKKNYNLASKEFSAFKAEHPASSLIPYANLRIAACSLLVKDADAALAAANHVLKSKLPVELETNALFIKGSALLDKADFAGAGAVFSKVANQSEFPVLAAGAFLRKAWAFRNLQQFPAFEKTLKTLEEKYPSSPQMALGKYLEGAFLYEQEKWDEAGNRFETAVLRYPYSAVSEAALALMTIAYTKANRLDNLVTAANSALKILEGHYTSQSVEWRAQSYYFIGRAYYQMERFSDALPLFEKITVNYSDHPRASRAQLYLAWCLVETGKYDKAREKARSLIENPKTEKPLVLNATFLEAISYFNAKQYDKGLTRMADFIKKNPKDELVPQVRYLMGLSYHQKKVFGSAIDEWSQLVYQHKEHPLAQDAYLQIGDLYFKSGKFAQAAKFFRLFREAWPNSKYVQIALWLEMQSYFNGGDDESAIKTYPLYIKKYPQAENAEDAKNQLETVYYRRGEPGDPAKLEEFLAKYPKSPYAPSARYKLGDMAMEQKAWNRATQEMEQFTRDYPKDPLFVDALYALGLAYEQSGQKEKAVVQYRQLMDQFATKPNAVDAAFRLGALFFAQADYQNAVQAFEFAIKKKLTDELRANVYYNLALSYENLGRLEEAASTYALFAKLATAKKPDQAREALMTAGLLMKKAGKYPKAIDYFSALLKNAGSKELELQVVNLLGGAYSSAGNKSQAIKTYEKLIGMEPAASDLRLAGLAQLAYLYEQ